VRTTAALRRIETHGPGPGAAAARIEYGGSATLEQKGFGAVQDEKFSVFKAMRPLAAGDVVRGQFTGYRHKPGVAADSDVETFGALRLFSDSAPAEGRPKYLRFRLSPTPGWSSRPLGAGTGARPTSVGASWPRLTGQPGGAAAGAAGGPGTACGMCSAPPRCSPGSSTPPTCPGWPATLTIGSRSTCTSAPQLASSTARERPRNNQVQTVDIILRSDSSRFGYSAGRSWRLAIHAAAIDCSSPSAGISSQAAR